jgi:hypothetical protein
MFTEPDRHRTASDWNPTKNRENMRPSRENMRGLMSDRDRRWPELLSVRLPRLTLARIRATLREGEDGAADFARKAIEAELHARERERRVEHLSTWIA